MFIEITDIGGAVHLINIKLISSFRDVDARNPGKLDNPAKIVMSNKDWFIVDASEKWRIAKKLIAGVYPGDHG